MKLHTIYSIIMREVNKSNGEISVRCCKKGIKEEIEKDFTYLQLRSIFNEDLSYYLTLQKNEEETIKELKNKNVKENVIYQKI